MTDHTDLIARLRRVPGPTLLLSHPAKTTPDPLSNEAADALEAQAKRIAKLETDSLFQDASEKAHIARIAELEAVLKPFKNISTIYPDVDDDGFITVRTRLLRAARTALEKK